MKEQFRKHLRIRRLSRSSRKCYNSYRDGVAFLEEVGDKCPCGLFQVFEEETHDISQFPASKPLRNEFKDT